MLKYLHHKVKVQQIFSLFDIHYFKQICHTIAPNFIMQPCQPKIEIKINLISMMAIWILKFAPDIGYRLVGPYLNKIVVICPFPNRLFRVWGFFPSASLLQMYTKLEHKRIRASISYCIEVSLINFIYLIVIDPFFVAICCINLTIYGVWICF